MTAVSAAVGAYVAWSKRLPRHLVYLSERAFPTSAQSASQSPVPAAWTALADRLAPGSRIEVDQRSASPNVRGNIDRFGDAGIQLLVDGEPYVIRRDDVRRIWTPRQSYWNAMGGLVLPVTGISMVTGGLICRGHETCVERYAASVAGLGIGLGVLNVFTKNRHALVYDAGKSSSSTAAAIYPAFGQHKAALQMAIHF